MKEKQCNRILRYVDEFGSITMLEAIRDVGIASLSRRICDLSNQGYKITKKSVTSINRYGDKTHFTRYYIDKT